MNIAAVTISTKTDKSKIDWAGVDTGAKIFVGLRSGCSGSANAGTAAQKRTSACVERADTGLDPSEIEAHPRRSGGRELSPDDWATAPPWRLQLRNARAVPKH